MVYCIKVNGQVKDSVHINQKIESGSWVKVGRFWLDAYAEVQIILMNTGTATDGSALYADAIKFEYLENVGISDKAINQFSSGSSSLQIYPNPFHNILNINSEQDQINAIEIFSISGKKVFTNTYGTNTCRVDLSSFQKGVYFITVTSKDFVTTRKIIKL